jgi:hypothetical protein
VGALVGAALAAELQHGCGGGAAAAGATLNGTLGEFCERHGAVAGWLVPLACAVWAVAEVDAAAMPARLALRALAENGLLVPGGDGSGGDTTWWAVRPRGGMAGVHRRARDKLAALGVELLPASEADLRVEADEPQGGVRVRRGDVDLGPRPSKAPAR